MKFSVYMACHNAEKFIEQAIGSVLSQTYKNFELIVVDDFSSDSTWERIQTMANSDPRVKHSRNVSKKCIGYSKRHACESADGDVLVMVDGDDFVSPNALQVLYDAYQAYPQYDCVYLGHYICDSEGKPIRRSAWIKQWPKSGSIAKGLDCVGHLLSFKKSVYELTNGYDCDRRYATDKQLLAELESVSRFKYIDTPLYYYRRMRTREEDKRAKGLFRETIEGCKTKEHGVSIIVPHSGKDRQSFLERTLGSLAAQTNRHFQVILSLADKQEDHELAEEMLDKFNPKANVKACFSPHEKGFSLGVHRNAAVRSSFYRRLFFLDSDILVPDTFVETCLREVDYNRVWFPIVKNEADPNAPEAINKRGDKEGWRRWGFGISGFMKRDFYFLDEWPEFYHWGYEDNLMYLKCSTNDFEIIREESELIHQNHPEDGSQGYSVPYKERKIFIDKWIKKYLKEIKKDSYIMMDPYGRKVIEKNKRKKIRLWDSLH